MQKMLVSNCGGILRKTSRPVHCIPKRSWAQVGHAVSTPPRVKVSFGEKLLHSGIMITVWTTPIAYFMTQLKVWRREYISP